MAVDNVLPAGEKGYQVHDSFDRVLTRRVWKSRYPQGAVDD